MHDARQDLAAAIERRADEAATDQISAMQADTIQALARTANHRVPQEVAGAIRATILTMRQQVLDEHRQRLVANVVRQTPARRAHDVRRIDPGPMPRIPD